MVSFGLWKAERRERTTMMRWLGMLRYRKLQRQRRRQLVLLLGQLRQLLRRARRRLVRLLKPPREYWLLVVVSDPHELTSVLLLHIQSVRKCCNPVVRDERRFSRCGGRRSRRVSRRWRRSFGHVIRDTKRHLDRLDRSMIELKDQM